MRFQWLGGGRNECRFRNWGEGGVTGDLVAAAEGAEEDAVLRLEEVMACTDKNILSCCVGILAAAIGFLASVLGF